MKERSVTFASFSLLALSLCAACGASRTRYHYSFSSSGVQRGLPLPERQAERQAKKDPEASAVQGER